MKLIPLTPLNYTYTLFYLAISRILAIGLDEDGNTYISIDEIDSSIIRVKETPEEIFELIKQQEQA